MKEAKSAERQAVLVYKLQMRRNNLGSKSRQRTQDWLSAVDKGDCQLICNGASGTAERFGPTMRDDEVGETILSPDKTFYDGFYLRTYEPDFVKRVKNAGLSSEHL